MTVTDAAHLLRLAWLILPGGIGGWLAWEVWGMWRSD